VKITNYDASLYCDFLHPPVKSSLSGQSILYSILFSHTLNLHSAFRERDQISHPVGWKWP